MFGRLRPFLTKDRFAKALLGQFQVPGWLFLILAIVIGVPDWTSRYQFWLGVAKSTSGKMSVVATILLWPYFPLVLAVIGLSFIANIPLKVIQLPDGFVSPDVEFVFFIGPQPIRWN